MEDETYPMKWYAVAVKWGAVVYIQFVPANCVEDAHEKTELHLGPDRVIAYISECPDDAP